MNIVFVFIDLERAKIKVFKTIASGEEWMKGHATYSCFKKRNGSDGIYENKDKTVYLAEREVEI